MLKNLADWLKLNFLLIKQSVSQCSIDNVPYFVTVS